MEQQKKSLWLNRNWKWAIPVGCLAPILVCGGFFTVLITVVFGMMKSSTPYTESLAAVKANIQIQQALSVPIEASYFVTGNVEASGQSGNADLQYTVSGPKGAGIVYVVATKAAGKWTFGTFVVEVESTGERINLLPLQ